MSQPIAWVNLPATEFNAECWFGFAECPDDLGSSLFFCVYHVVRYPGKYRVELNGELLFTPELESEQDAKNYCEHYQDEEEETVAKTNKPV